MKTIKIHFSSPKDFKIGAEAIKVYQGFTCYSHVAIELNCSMVYHSAYGSVHFMSMEDFLHKNKICKTFSIEITEDQLDTLFRTALELNGIVYGYDELLKIVVSDLIWNLTGNRESFANSKGFICSELIATLLEMIFKTPFHKPKHIITPKDIDNYLEFNIY